jgi:hypothetical protein
MALLSYWKNWDKVKDNVKSLAGRFGFEKGREIRFLGFKLSLENGKIYDEILNEEVEDDRKGEIYYVLYIHSQATEDVGETGEYASFTELFKAYGEYALKHCPAFKSVCKEFEEGFGRNPEPLRKVAEILGCEIVDYGDVALKIYALPKVPIILVIWVGDEEMPPSSNILFDKSAVNYIPECEALVRLAKITVERVLSIAKSHKPIKT